MKVTVFVKQVKPIMYVSFTDDNQSVRAVLTTRHRVQDALGNMGHASSRGGLNSSGQVPDEAPGSSVVLLEYGGAGARSRSTHHACVGRRRASRCAAGVSP